MKPTDAIPSVEPGESSSSAAADKEMTSPAPIAVESHKGNTTSPKSQRTVLPNYEPSTANESVKIDEDIARLNQVFAEVSLEAAQTVLKEKWRMQEALRNASADKIAAQNSEKTEDAMIVERLKTVNAETLVEWLATAKRLGYRADDIRNEEDESFYPNMLPEVGATTNKPPQCASQYQPQPQPQQSHQPHLANPYKFIEQERQALVYNSMSSQPPGSHVQLAYTPQPNISLPGFGALQASIPSHYQANPQHTNKKRKYDSQEPIGGSNCNRMPLSVNGSNEREIWEGITSPQTRIVNIRRKRSDSLLPNLAADTTYCQARKELGRYMKNLSTNNVKHLALPYESHTSALAKYLKTFTSLKTITFVLGGGDEDEKLVGVDFYLIDGEPWEYTPAKKASLERCVSEAFRSVAEGPKVMYKIIEILSTPGVRET